MLAMDPKPQNVLDYHGTNTLFMVWNFKEGVAVKDAFARTCALVLNLNHSATVKLLR